MATSPPVENVLPSGADTVLTISSFGNMLYQARGLTQTLETITAASQLERTINGNLIDVSAAQFRKYQSQISVSSEVDAPPLDGVYPGMEVTVGCAVELSYPTGKSGSPHRTEVSGSSYSQNGFTFYRPLLTMLVKDVKTNLDEWGRKVGWTVDLEEV
jgi:hypothetical protein